MKKVKYIKRFDAYIHALRSNMVNNKNEFNKKFPEKKYVFIKGKYGLPYARERK